MRQDSNWWPLGPVDPSLMVGSYRGKLGAPRKLFGNPHKLGNLFPDEEPW